MSAAGIGGLLLPLLQQPDGPLRRCHGFGQRIMGAAYRMLAAAPGRAAQRACQPRTKFGSLPVCMSCAECHPYPIYIYIYPCISFVPPQLCTRNPQPRTHACSVGCCPRLGPPPKASDILPRGPSVRREPLPGGADVFFWPKKII